MASLYTELALYSSKNDHARTDTVFLPISEVCDGTVSLATTQGTPLTITKMYFLLCYASQLWPKKNKLKLWHVTHDMWHVTCDMWHMTCDMRHVTHDTWHDMLWFMIYDILKNGRKKLADWMTELINDKGVCRTVPTTQGLLKIYMFFIIRFIIKKCHVFNVLL